MMARTPSPRHRLQRQMALLMPAVADAGQASRPRCRVACCGHAAGANGLICSAHYFAMPAADARFLVRLQAAKRRARDPEISTYLAEQIEGYASQFARKGMDENGGRR